MGLFFTRNSTVQLLTTRARQAGAESARADAQRLHEGLVREAYAARAAQVSSQAQLTAVIGAMNKYSENLGARLTKLEGVENSEMMDLAQLPQRKQIQWLKDYREKHPLGDCDE